MQRAFNAKTQRRKGAKGETRFDQVAPFRRGTERVSPGLESRSRGSLHQLGAWNFKVGVFLEPALRALRDWDSELSPGSVTALGSSALPRRPRRRPPPPFLCSNGRSPMSS